MSGKGAEQRPQHKGSLSRKDYQPDITSTDLLTRIGQSLTTLTEELQHGRSERLMQYLAFSSRFHRYSRANQMLIFEQRPDSTRVASYQTWKKEGYQVAKGEKGIRILVPRPYVRHDEERDKDVEIAVRFIVGSVFDVSQLTPEKRPPEFFTTIAGDHEAVYQRLVAAVRAEGIDHRESLDTEGARGYSAGGFIVVRPDQPVGNKAAVIAHEWAHEILHKEEERRSLPTQVKECHAEATAYVVLSHFGIEIPYSVDYLLNWGNTPETLRQELDVVTKAASHIITKVHALEPGEAHFHDPTEADGTE